MQATQTGHYFPRLLAVASAAGALAVAHQTYVSHSPMHVSHGTSRSATATGDVAAANTGTGGGSGGVHECDCAPLWNCLEAKGDCAALDRELRECLKRHPHQ